MFWKTFPHLQPLFITCILAFAGLIPLQVFAHPSPNSLVFLDISPDRVAMEIQLPVPELEFAFGQNIAAHPETLIEQQGPQLKKYITEHIHAYIVKDHPWQVELRAMQMEKTPYAGTNAMYWEVVAFLILKPQSGKSTRRFFLDYDVIMHQVVTHTALLTLRSDWENGTTAERLEEASAIRRSIADNVVYPVEITLEKGSRWKGFKSMFGLGMQHIEEGTDHLLFLLVLLLPAMLLVQGGTWGKFGGIKYSAKRLLQIVTAFTIGHSITLLISAAGWVKLPSQPVEILIAFSILISAIHALYPMFPGREVYVAAGFGLIHGLAFATILSNMKLGAATLVLSILGFNLGIEVMQLFIVVIVVPWLVLLSMTPLYKWVRTTCAILAGIAALAWIAERSLGKANWVSTGVAKVAAYGLWCILALMVFSLLMYGWYYKKKGTLTYNV